MTSLETCDGGIRRLAVLATDGEIHLIPVQALRPGPWQPRRVFDTEGLAELAISIQEQGVLTPLRVVRSVRGTEYLIVTGERRWRAAGLAGLSVLPCMVMIDEDKTSNNTLHELAVLDNLHRANLRPGEEARAIRDLSSLGMTQREIAQRLGKSVTWVSHRQTIARLPSVVLERLDGGAVTREEAIALCKLLEYPDLIEACLETDGRRLAARLCGHVPEDVGERVQAVLRVLTTERQRENWAAKMRGEGHRVLDRLPGEGDKHFARLVQGSELARVHQEARLSCEAWAWENGHPVRYCSDPIALRSFSATGKSKDPAEQERQAAHQRVIEREATRDAVISAWLETSRSIHSVELGILARHRIRALTTGDDRLAARLGNWLGASGDRNSRVAAAKLEIETASERRLIQLWFLLEAAQTLSHSIAPEWLTPWLESLGLADSSQVAHYQPASPPHNPHARSYQ